MRVKVYLGVLVIGISLLIGTVACSTRSNNAVPSTIPPTRAAQIASQTPMEETQPTPQAQDLVPSLPSMNLLDAATTFEVIAAVHAYLLEIDAWQVQGFSLFERQAIVLPLAEISISPLGTILMEFTPHADLAESWHQAAEIYLEFFPQLNAWAAGDLADSDFSEALAGLSTRSEEVMAGAERMANILGVETDQYGSDFALAKGVVFQLAPGVMVPAVEAGAVKDVLEENPALEVRELTPFFHPFAGMDVFLTIGLLENTGTQAQERVEVKIKFFNFLGEHLGTLAGRVLNRVALPGEVYPFSASILVEGEEEALKDWVEYEVTFFSRAFDSTVVVYRDFDLTVSSASSSSGGYMIEGTLTNLGTEAVPLEEIRITVMALDSAGNLVGVGNGSALSEGLLQPGMSISFQAFLDAVNGEPTSYQFFAEASK